MQLSQQELLALAAAAASGEDITAALDQLAAQASVSEKLYTYTNQTAVAAGANALAAGVTSAPINTQIEADASFLWVATTYFATTLNAAQSASSQVVPNATVLMVDTGSGRQLMNAAVPLPSIAGNGQFPYMLPRPMLIAANSILQCTYTNFDAAAGYNLFLAFHGYKIYKLTQP